MMAKQELCNRRPPIDLFFLKDEFIIDPVTLNKSIYLKIKPFTFSNRDAKNCGKLTRKQLKRLKKAFKFLVSDCFDTHSSRDSFWKKAVKTIQFL